MRPVLVLFAVAVACAKQFSYEGYQVYSVIPKTDEQLKFLEKFRNNPLLDFWSPLRIVEKPVDVMVNPQIQRMFKWLLDLHEIQHHVLIDNVETVFRQERRVQVQARKLGNKSISFQKYNRFNEIEGYLKQLAYDYPNLVTLEKIGKSFLKRDLTVIQISSDPEANKPVVFIDAGIHAREWIAPAMALYVIHQLVDSKYRQMLDKIDWHILPLMNPDGYEYSHKRQRLWRKTRSTRTDLPCTGTDGNRNFDFYWGEIGASSDSCDEEFMGPQPFSESETRSVSNYITKWNHQIKLYLTLHSFGNYLLYPWGFTTELPQDDAELQELAEKVNEAIVQAGGKEYMIGTSSNVLYKAAGGSDDWAKGVAGIQLSYTIELPGGGLHGFDLPASRILSIVNETFPGIAVYGEYVAQKFGN